MQDPFSANGFHNGTAADDGVLQILSVALLAQQQGAEGIGGVGDVDAAAAFSEHHGRCEGFDGLALLQTRPILHRNAVCFGFCAVELAAACDADIIAEAGAGMAHFEGSDTETDRKNRPTENVKTYLQISKYML